MRNGHFGRPPIREGTVATRNRFVFPTGTEKRLCRQRPRQFPESWQVGNANMVGKRLEQNGTRRNDRHGLQSLGPASRNDGEINVFPRNTWRIAVTKSVSRCCLVTKALAPEEKAASMYSASA
jgi:hypothetical protein